MIIEPPELEGMSIVLLGSFNPAIFHPEWFRRHSLLGESECEKASVQVISQEIAMFSIGWVAVDVTADRIALTTNQSAYFEPLRDLILGVFTLLNHTPIRVIAVNWMLHYKADAATWKQCGESVLNKPLLNTALPGIDLMTLSLGTGTPRDELPGRAFRVVIEPSVKTTGIFTQFSVTWSSEEKPGFDNDALRSRLHDGWAEALAKLKDFNKGVISLCR